MIIRKEQMDTLSMSMLEQFVHRMVAHLKQSFPAQTENMPDDDLRNSIRQSMTTAEKYDIKDEVDIERYLECTLLYSHDFDVNPETAWAGEILRNKDLSGFDKMNRINDYELFSLKLGQP